jgi:DnaJ-domain-containing protein 1
LHWLFWRPSTVKNAFRRFFHWFSRRLPGPFKVIAGPFFGGLIGLAGGIAGVLIGIVLGYLVQELFGQFRSDREALRYFENPGPSGFYEGEPGLAAFCALGILIIAQAPDSSPFSLSVPATDGDAAAGEVSRKAAAFFPGSRADASLMEYFCRLAWSCRQSLNPDLLAESLMARRSAAGDLGDLGRALYELASGEKSRDLARTIRAMLDSTYNPQAEKDEAPKAPEEDPWKVLGLEPGTPVKEVKSRFRKLAIRFHPDSLQDMDDGRRETAARAFIAIEEAYKKIVAGGKERRNKY